MTQPHDDLQNPQTSTSSMRMRACKWDAENIDSPAASYIASLPTFHGAIVTTLIIAAIAYSALRPDSLLVPLPCIHLLPAEMEGAFHVKVVFLLSCLLLCGQLAHGLTKFSELAKSLIVNYEAQNGTKAGLGQINIKWSLDTAVLSADNANALDYKTVNVKLCFGKISQVDRAWRKTNDLLAKDKTCLHDMGKQNFTAAGNTLTYTVLKEVPFAHYFIRAYVLNSAAEKIAYGQTSPTDLFTIEPITGRHASIDIAAGVFSAFAVLSLFGFYFAEKKISKKG
ncbi:hypothetical protein L7F22_027557 [Adiantum nelumboides]|nr:hypothetical protein [Adiantum nelumboides]MCO5573783.1 hypothetical protein [Adiantum nelumboides]